MTPVSTAGAASELIAKHLPPSASTLRLLDLGGTLSAALLALRPDLDVTVGVPPAAGAPDNVTYDAVVAYEVKLDDALLRQILPLLRPGGRLIAVDPQGVPDRVLVERLESAGYGRILVEDTFPTGVLLRGEQPHTTTDTLARIQRVAARDTLNAFKGRFLHLLIRQTPNKPVWALQPGEAVEWSAVAVADDDGEPLLLAFSSLPNAVAFMQPAVIAGSVKDVNKVAKFSRATAQNWRVLINPPLNVLDGREVVSVPVDPALAEAPDE